MSSSRFSFGRPPLPFLAAHLAQDAGFLAALQPIIDLEEGAYQRLAAELTRFRAFLSRADLREMVAACLGESSSGIASVIEQVAEVVHDADMDAPDAMGVLAKAIEEKAVTLDAPNRRKLVSRLRGLVVEPSGISKQYKAVQLVEAIGAELDAFRLICDIRPIFDPERRRIEGAIPLAILRLEYTEPDGAAAVVEVRVTERQIKEIEEKMGAAMLKLGAIKELLSQQQLPIPKTKATVAEGES